MKSKPIRIKLDLLDKLHSVNPDPNLAIALLFEGRRGNGQVQNSERQPIKQVASIAKLTQPVDEENQAINDFLVKYNSAPSDQKPFLLDQAIFQFGDKILGYVMKQ